MPVQEQLIRYAIALGLGLLIGAERERRKGVGTDRSSSGVRTFAVASLLGAVSSEVGGNGLLAVVCGGVGLLAAIGYYRNADRDPGVTTEATLLLTVLLGALALREPATASALAVTVTLLLQARTLLHRFVRSLISEAELNDGLLLAAAALVVWPLAPDVYVGPYAALNPRAIWKIVLLILTASSLGYVCLRALGARYGLPIAGLTSGFVSSAATISAMGERSRANPSLLRGAVAGAVLSTVATIVQLMLVLQATSPALMKALLLPLLLSSLAAVAYGVLFTVRALEAPPQTLQPGKPFSIKTALFFALSIVVVVTAAAGLQDWLGDRGVLAAGALGGFVDAHAAAISVGTLVAAGKIPVEDALFPVLLGLTTNTMTKAFLAVGSGSRRFAAAVLPGLLLVIGSAWLGILFLR